MQDNYNNDFEQFDQFADQGWKQMQGMLDKEMPAAATIRQGSKGKSYLGFLLLFLLSFGAGVGSVLLWQQNIDVEETQPLEIQQHIPVAENETKATTDNELVVLNESINTVNSTPTPVTTQSTKFTSPLAFQTFSLPAYNYGKVSNQTIGYAQDYFRKYFQNKTNNTPVNNPTLTTATASKTELLKLSPKTLDPFESSNLLPINLTKASLALLESKDKKEAVTTLKIPENEKVKVKVAWLAGLHTEPSKGYGGYSTGLMFDIEVDQRFGLQTGLNFSRFQFNDINLNDSPDAFDLNSSDGSAPGLSNDVIEVPFTVRSTSGGAALPLGSASYVSIPVFLTYKPFKKFRINMGVEYARMIAASANKLRNSNSNFDYKTSYDFLEGSSPYGNLLNKTNFSASFGFSYIPQGPFALDLRYNHGFTDLSKNTQQLVKQNDTRESLQFSLMYYFGNKAAAK